MTAKSKEKIPTELSAALRGKEGAVEAWEGLGPSCRREYVKWVVEGKKVETRERRAASVVEKIGMDAMKK